MIDILAIGAHPDDVELAAGGTLLVQSSLGKTTAIVDLTRGELGTRGNAELREAEAKVSAGILNLKERINLDLADGFFEADEFSLLKLVVAIRYFKPNIVLANAIEDRHPDHSRAADFISRACFLSGLRKIETRRGDEVQESFRPKAVYHFIQDRFIQPDFVVDITEHFSKKMEAVKAFKSQFYNADNTEPTTPISSLDFLNYLESRAREMGRLIGCTFGEGFTAERPIGLKDLNTIF
jgi:N-acetylglucosamine malate deacetylase 1